MGKFIFFYRLVVILFSIKVLTSKSELKLLLSELLNDFLYKRTRSKDEVCEL